MCLIEYYIRNKKLLEINMRVKYIGKDPKFFELKTGMTGIVKDIARDKNSDVSWFQFVIDNGNRGHLSYWCPKSDLELVFEFAFNRRAKYIGQPDGTGSPTPDMIGIIVNYQENDGITSLYQFEYMFPTGGYGRWWCKSEDIEFIVEEDITI